MPKYTSEETIYLINNYPILGAVECSKYLNRTPDTISHKANKLGLKVSDERIRANFNKQIRNPNTLNINPNKFISVETPNHAYLLGFIWGDGWIGERFRRIAVTIGFEDSQNLKPVFDSVGKWTEVFYTKLTENHQDKYKFFTNNKALYYFLHNLNYNEKSYISHRKPLEYIPDKWKYLWIRGLIDADGCFNKSKNKRHFSICSSYEQDWDYLLHYFSTHHVYLKLERNILKYGKNSNIYCNNYDNILNIGNFIYPNLWDGIGLKRKFNKWIHIIQSYKFKLIPENLINYKII